MSPLAAGPGTVRQNVTELMTGKVESPARKKAIKTLMKKHNITEKDARFKQAIAIAASQARKK